MASSTSSGKTSRRSSLIRTTHLGVSWENLPGYPGIKRSRQGADGTLLVTSMDPKLQSRGGPSMPHISSWPSVGQEFLPSLSSVLEPTTPWILSVYSLSAEACAGILRRAAERGKQVPPVLKRALLEIAIEGGYLDAVRQMRPPEERRGKARRKRS